ncbi:DUF7500 family protein [Haladaptatus sp. DFWS20]|uniref:DUF7500 family protein n=1 Tax=Haladaptatus sp. DFWS20 TaxID=3403467 RepID=UPI003EBCC745
MGPARDKSEAETGSVLSVDELDIERSDNVVALDEGRYVIGSGGEPSVSNESTLASSSNSSPAAPSDSTARSETTPESASSPQSSPNRTGESESSSPHEPRIDSRDVRRWLEDDLDDVDSRYGFHISTKSEGTISHQQMFSDDVETVFDSLLMWYVQQVDRTTAVEDVLGIPLMESNVRVRYSPRCFRGVLEAPDLFEAIRDANGVVFPPETDR